MGEDYFKKGPDGNNIHKSNVPHVRVEFRDEVYYYLLLSYYGFFHQLCFLSGLEARNELHLSRPILTTKRDVFLTGLRVLASTGFVCCFKQSDF